MTRTPLLPLSCSSSEPAPRSVLPRAALRRSSTWRLAIGALLSTTLLIGCEALQSLDSLLAGQQKPTASIKGLRIDGISAEGLQLTADVEVGNPYSVALPLVDVGYQLGSSGRTFLEGQAPLSGSIPAGGNQVLKLPMNITFKTLLDVLTDVKPGSVVPYDAALSLAVDAPVLGRVSLPIKRQGELPVPTTPEVTIQDVKWSGFSTSDVGGTLKLGLLNVNDFPIQIREFSYGLRWNDVDVSSGQIDATPSLQPGQSSSIAIPLSISPAKLGTAAFSLLSGGGDLTDYGLTGTLDLSTPFGDLVLPLSDLGSLLGN